MRFLSLFAVEFASVRTDRPPRPSRFLLDRCAPRETLIGRTRWRRTTYVSYVIPSDADSQFLYSSSLASVLIIKVHFNSNSH
ncbi:hypothetical protein PUN28_013340 [Cardiocondyla obscurior]|uniref:Secreted protein n=1 Tax=Cardiocondyla obscurior TaxID=286306 RepID=A0AAW2FBA9_9HYME